MKLKRLRLSRINIAIVNFFQVHLRSIGLVILIGLLSLSLFKISHLFKKFTFFQPPINYLGNSNGRTNFLLLGVKGENNTDVPDLADTIIIASYHHQSKQITMISVPRDLWVDSLKTKINAVFHYGQERNPPAGINLIQGSIQETLGIPIHYTAVINFLSFKQAVDLLGGVEINVETSFKDEHFPISGKENSYPINARYQTIEFKKGTQTMDGETVLKFVRSRQAEGEEGTDFARSKRQQLVIKALRSKLLSKKVIFNKSIRQSLYKIFQDNLITNITPKDYLPIARLILNSRKNAFNSINLTDENSAEEIAILENPPSFLYKNQWVLIAKDNNWPALKQFIQNKLNFRQP